MSDFSDQSQDCLCGFSARGLSSLFDTGGLGFGPLSGAGSLRLSLL